jgi:hypothetical protein
MHACRAAGRPARPGWAPVGARWSPPGLEGRLGVALHAGGRLEGRLQVHGGARQAWRDAWESRCTLDGRLGVALHAGGSLKRGPIKILYIKKIKKSACPDYVIKHIYAGLGAYIEGPIPDASGLLAPN